MRTIMIPERFCGPPGSANGGYASGLTALPLGGKATDVRLLAPVPVERPLELEVAPHEVRLLSEGRAVTSGRLAATSFDPAPQIGYEQACSAVEAFDVDQYQSSHPFPGCFTCGPARPAGDGLRIFPGRVEQPAMSAWPWTPGRSVQDSSGLVPVPVVWAALDCLSGFVWLTVDPLLPPMVLGRMAVVIHRQPVADEPLVVVAWAAEQDGRKRGAGSAIWTATGELLANSRLTWITLTSEQLTAFRAAT